MTEEVPTVRKNCLKAFTEYSHLTEKKVMYGKIVVLLLTLKHLKRKDL